MLIHLTTTGRYSSRGFTLIEVLCTLAMLSILSALAVPAMADLAARHRIDGLRAELIQSIQGARSEALARGQTVTLSRLTGCSTALVGASDWGWGPGRPHRQQQGATHPGGTDLAGASGRNKAM